MNTIIHMNHSLRYRRELESPPAVPRENDVYRLYMEAIAAFGKASADDIIKNITRWDYNALCAALLSALCDADRRAQKQGD